MNWGSTRWRGRAKIPRAPRAAHSKRPRPSETPKLMFAGWLEIPSSASMPSKFG